MRKSWTDERLDDFRGEVAERFGKVDERFDGLEKRLDRMEGRLDRVDDRLDGLHRVMAHGAIALSVGMFTGFAALFAALLTQL